FDEAEAAVQRGLAIIDRFKLEELKFQADYLMGQIAFERGEYAQSADHFNQALERIGRSVLVGSDTNLLLPALYGLLARSYVYAGNLDAAESALEQGFEQDPSEPALWLSKARFQQHSGLNDLARASVNYALAIWKDADEDYRWARAARRLLAELNSTG
ncbi:MAG: tetratricopeptide repeat protein, partial [Xanthomonadales bacterium]|nr:tetratricopeptide repeat protein [Xanthomonadales bacterium]